MMCIKKPIELEAFRYDGNLKDRNGEYQIPEWAVEAFEYGTMFYTEEDPDELYINTLEGTHHVSVGDYIIQGVQGDVYPCKQNIFNNTYEIVTRWIPTTEQLPEDDKYILLSFENFSVPLVGRYEEDEEGGAFYVGDDSETCSSQGIIVNAWMSLPEQYREES